MFTMEPAGSTPDTIRVGADEIGYRAGNGSNSFAVQTPRAWSLAMNLTNAAPASGAAALASTAPSYDV